MDGLRWLLLVFGLVVVAGVYLYTRHQRKQAADSPQQDMFSEGVAPEPAHSRKEPVFGESTEAEDPPETPELPESLPDQKIVTLRIVARNSGAFSGDDLVLSLRGIGMSHGKFGIFHRYDGTGEENVVFSAASLVEPGSFDLTNIKDQEIPGISLFMILPGPLEGAEGFDMMMATARALSQSLDAELLDESGSTLSIQRERYLREEIIQYEHSAGLA